MSNARRRPRSTKASTRDLKIAAAEGQQTGLPPVKPATDDPAWQPPRDPLKGGAVRARATVIHREVPLVTIATSWTVDSVRKALSDITQGIFDQPAQLVDAIVGDDRVQATLGSRTGGLFGRPLRHRRSRLPGVDEKLADECLEAWKRIWPATMTEPVLSEVQQWGVMLGFCPGQILWDTSDDDLWVPYLRTFHPKYTYYQFTLRQLIATTLDGQVAITPGDGHWFLHAPHGDYRGWMRGAVRSVAQPWLIRNLAYRDWARLSERHGFPIFLARTPAAGDPKQIDAFRSELATLGQESVLELPQGVDKTFSYDLDLLEAGASDGQVFDMLIRRCEMSIVLALLFQNLTTEVKEGSLAAAREHGDVRQSALLADARALSHTIYTQIARPFAAINFGDPDLAPTSEWDIEPYEDKAAVADIVAKLATAAQQFAAGGYQMRGLTRLCRELGVQVSFKKVDPITPGTAPAPTDDDKSESDELEKDEDADEGDGDGSDTDGDQADGDEAVPSSRNA